MTTSGAIKPTGFTILEILLVVSITMIVLMIGQRSLIEYREATAARDGARIVAQDVHLARSLATKRRELISLVFDPGARGYAIRSVGSGDPLRARSFTEGDVRLDELDTNAQGDSLTFDPRGVLTGGASVEVVVTRGRRERRVVVDPLGRTRMP